MSDVCEKHGLKLLTYGTLVRRSKEKSFTDDIPSLFSAVDSWQTRGWQQLNLICTPVISHLPRER